MSVNNFAYDDLNDDMFGNAAEDHANEPHLVILSRHSDEENFLKLHAKSSDKRAITVTGSLVISF